MSRLARAGNSGVERTARRNRQAAVASSARAHFRQILTDTTVARLLFEGPVSGSGETADWECAGELATRTELVLAGGLRTTNVAAAIDRVRPYGVDVSSGVESQPGVKSPREILEFVKAARAAFLEMQR